MIERPQFEFIDDYRIRLIADWHVDFCIVQIVVPKGFETDGASVPRLFWNIITPFGPIRYEAILHDFGYQYGYWLTTYDDKQAYNLQSYKAKDYFPEFGKYIPIYINSDRIFFDKIFDDKMPHVSNWQSFICYKFVRQFGQYTWDKYRTKGPKVYGHNSLGLPGIINGQLVVC